MKERLIAKVSDVVAETLKIPVDRVMVIVEDVPATAWGVGGRPLGKI